MKCFSVKYRMSVLYVSLLSSYILAVCPPCIDTNSSACSRWGEGRAFFKWTSDPQAGSDITLTATAGSCGGASGGEGGKAYVGYVCDTHSDICKGDTPCDDGFYYKESVAIIKVSGSKKAFKNTLGGLSFTSDKTYTDHDGVFFTSIGVGETGCEYQLPMAGAGSGRIKVQAGIMNLNSGDKGGKFNISVKFYAVLEKTGESDRYVLLAATKGSITVRVNQSRNSNPVGFQPDLRDGSSIAGNKPIERYYAQVYGDTSWKLDYRGGYSGNCQHSEFWAGICECENDTLIPAFESFTSVKYPGWGSGVNGTPPYAGQSGWSTTQPYSSYAMLAMNGSDWLWRYLLMSSGYIQSTQYMMHYEMGNLGRMFYRGEEYSGGLRVRQIEYCAHGVNFGQGQILWTFCYDSQNRIHYIHNASYDDPNNPPDPNSPDDATAYYNYDYTQGDGNDPIVTYYTRPDTQSAWSQQRNWELEFDSEGRAVKFQGGCSSGCGGTGTFEHVEYLPGRDDLITKQYNAADTQILDNQYEEIIYGQYEPAGGIRISNGGFELPDVPANGSQSVSSLPGWDLTNGPVKICDPDAGSGSQYLELKNDIEQTLWQVFSSVSSNSFYTLQADIRAHNLTGKHGVVELWIVKDGNASEKVATIDANDLNLQGATWNTKSVTWNNTSDTRFGGILLQDLWFFKVVVKGLKVDMDNVTLSKSIWVGSTTKPILKQQQKRDSQGQLVTTLTRQFDKDYYRITERQFVSSNECRVTRYDYEDQTFTNLVKKIEWQNLGTASTLPTGTSYETMYSNDANNVITLPGGKRADCEFYDPCGKVSMSYRHDIENDANAMMEQYEYDVDNDNGPVTDSRLKKHTNASGGVTEYEYTLVNNTYGAGYLLWKKIEPQTAAGRLVTEYAYDGARRQIEEKKYKQGESNLLLQHTVNHYNPATGYLDWTEEGLGTDGGGYAATYYKYNSLGQVIRQTNPDGVQTGKTYGSGGQLVSEFTIAAGWDPNLPDSSLRLLSQTRYTYNNDGLIEKIGKYKADGDFLYNTSIPDPADPNYWVITKHEYYPDGKQKKIIEDFGGANLTTEYSYNLLGEVEKVIYPTGKWVKTTRDGRGLVILEEVGHGTSTVVMETSYDYDADGNLKEQHNPDGTSQYYTYDNFGRVKRIYQRDLDGPYTEKFYDNAGNVIRELSVDSADTNRTLLRDIRRQYDKAGNLELERICAQPNQVDNAADVMTWYVYDVLGNLVKNIQEGLDCCDPNDIPNTSDVITRYFYDGLGRKQHTLSPTGVLSSVFYTPAGLPEKIVDPNDPVDPNLFVTENFYDAAGRLEKTVDPEGHYTVNVYNSLNQLIKQTVFDCNESPDNTNNDFAVRQTRTQYDNLGNVIRQVVMKDPTSQGNPVTGEDMITDFVYDYDTGLLYQTKTWYGDTPTAAVTTYDYDTIGRKIGTIDPEGNEDHIVYSVDTPALVEKTQRLENNPGGNDYTITTFFEYDNYGRLWKRILDLDGDGSKESTDTTTTYLYDGLGRLTNEIAPDGIVTFTDYDGFGNVWQKIEDYDPENEDAFNKTTEYVYSRLNRLYQINAYDPNDTTSQVIVQTTTYEYDKAGLVTMITYPDYKSVEYIYNIQNKLDTEIQRNGKWIAYWYDQNRNLIQISDYDATDPNCPIGAATFIETFTYDAANNLKTASKVQDGDSVSHSEFTYNGFGLKTSETATYFELQPVVTTWDYDSSGNLISQTPGGTTSTYTHDGLGRIKTIDRNEDRIVNYSYIGSGTKAIEYPEPEVTQSYSYDELGRVDGVGSVDGDENTILDFVYDYDTVGNRRSEKYNHLTIPVWDKFYFDNLRRLNQIDYAASSGFAQSSRSVPASEFIIPNEREDSVYKLSFLASYVLRWLDEDGMNKLNNNPVNPVNPVKTYSSVNSGNDRLLTLAEFGGAADTEPNIRSETIYDDSGRLSAQIVYDANGNMTLFAMYPDSGGKVVVTSAYDSSGNQISNICTTYDAEGNILSREDMPVVTENVPVTETTEAIESVIPAQAGIQSFASDVSASSQADLWLLEAELLYDDGGMMLMSAPSGPSAASEVFTYDHLGNRYQYTDKDGLITTYTHNPVNQYGLISKDLNFYGFKDQLYPLHDDNGNLSEDGKGYTFTYDYHNRLVSIDDGASTIAQYTYDALGRRIAKTVGDTTTLFYYDTENRVISEYGQDLQDLQREYVYGNGFTEILAMFLPQYDVGQEDWEQFLAFCESWLSNDSEYDHNSDGIVNYIDFAYFATVWGTFPSGEESHFYYLHDALGSVRGLVGGKFNREEDREFYNYDVYGATTDSSVSGNPFRFAGYRYDTETGTYHLENRTYEPSTGRFLQIDPLGTNPAGGLKNAFKPLNQYSDDTNLYGYAKSNPALFVDPLGLSGCYPIPIAQPASNDVKKEYAKTPDGWPIVPGDAWEKRPAECTAIDGYFRHCVSACRLNRLLRASGSSWGAPLATYTIGLWWGNDWPWNKNQAVDSPSDREAYRHGIAFSYLPIDCRSLCTKGLVTQCKKRCPCDQPCDQTAPVISGDRKHPIPY